METDKLNSTKAHNVAVINSAEMQQIENQLNQCHREDGMISAVRMVMKEPFTHWMDKLADASTPEEAAGGTHRYELHAEKPDGMSVACILGRTDVLALAVSMNWTLSMRDALLVSIIIDEERASREYLMGFVERPMLASNARRLETLLNESFRDPRAKPDMERCERGIDMLFQIFFMVPEKYRAQPLAVISYILWWLGRDAGAMQCALDALEVDEGCSLAAIVCSACQRHIGPAWVYET